MPEFKPSPESKTPVEEAVHLLRYIRKVSKAAEVLVEEVDDVPVWELERLRQSAAHLTRATMTLRKEAQIAPPKPQPKRSNHRRRSEVVKKIIARAKEHGEP